MPRLAVGTISCMMLSISIPTPIPSYVSAWQWIILWVIAVVILHLAYKLIFYPKYFTPFLHLPTHPHRSILTGNEIGLFCEPQWAVARRLSENVPNSGILRYYAALNQERLLITSPNGLSEVLVQRVSDWDHPPFMKFAASRITGKGLQFAHADEHKKQRKNLMPAFSPSHIKTLIPIFWQKTVDMIHGMETEIHAAANDQHEIQLSDWSARAALDIIGLAGLGYDFRSLREANNEFAALTKLYRTFMASSSRLFPWLGVLMNYFDARMLHYIPEPRNMALTRSFNIIRKHAENIVRVRKNRMQSDEDKNETTGKDIITVALHSGMFSTEALLHHVMTSIVVGHLSTSITFDWVCFELGRRPDVQARLRDEIRTMLSGTRLEDTSASNIEALPYLNAVCSETLRFYPPLAIALRIAVKDTSILGTEIPRGTNIAYCAEAINHDKDLWGPDAHIWNPERWMGPGRGSAGGACSNFAFMTFSAGPRNCIGQWWERAELACMVAAVIGRFDLRLLNEKEAARVERAPAMMSSKGVVARLTPISGW